MANRIKSQSVPTKVMEVLGQLAFKERGASTRDIFYALLCQTTRQEKQVRNALSDLYLAGRVERISQGVYRLAQRQETLQKQAAMWRILRARRTVTVDDLQELAGTSDLYAKEWLRTLIKHGLMRRLPDGKFQLVKDPGPTMPALTDNAEKLRRLRAEKKTQAIAAISRARQALDEAERAIDTIDKEEI